MDDDQRRANGERIRREVLGDAHVDGATAATTLVTADFQDYITRVAWGDIWARPGLDRSTRSCLTVALLATLGHWDEFRMHVRAALRNGVAQEQLTEVMLHTAVYAGVPVANQGLAIADQVFDEVGGDVDTHQP